MNNFSSFNNGKKSSSSASGNSKKSGGYHRNTLEDLLTGHYKNSYGVEGMCVTGRSDYKKIVSINIFMMTLKKLIMSEMECQEVTQIWTLIMIRYTSISKLQIRTTVFLLRGR